jgi:hypothetical protein
MFSYTPCTLQDNPYTSSTLIRIRITKKLISQVLNTNTDVFRHLVDKSYVTVWVNQSSTLQRYYSRKYFRNPDSITTPSVPSHMPDLFQYFPDAVLHSVRDLKTYLILDCGTEGFSDQMQWCNLWETIYSNCVDHQIDPAQLIVFTSNLVAEQAVHQLAHEQGWSGSFRVFSYPYFQILTTALATTQLDLNQAVQLHTQHHTDKIFSSLSRVNRPDRTWAQFQLSVSDIGALGLISHDKLPKSDPAHWLTQQGYPCDLHTVQQFTQWTHTLPLVVDLQNFSVNWGYIGDYEHIHHSTCFQIVNETLTSDYAGSSMFYSEKTFRAIRCFQPFVIFGQPGANHYLKHLGYQLYDAWFDLSWDFIQDPVDRHRAMISAITPLVKWLAESTPAVRHQWRFQHADILQHNADVMRKSENIKNKLSEFLTQLP